MRDGRSPRDNALGVYNGPPPIEIAGDAGCLIEQSKSRESHGPAYRWREPNSVPAGACMDFSLVLNRCASDG